MMRLYKNMSVPKVSRLSLNGWLIMSPRQVSENRYQTVVHRTDVLIILNVTEINFHQLV